MPSERKIRLDLPPAEGATYEVGYRKPPAASRFQPGRSGNPKGRPRGARNRRPGPDEERLKAIVLDEAYRTIKVNEGERRITLTIAEAVIRALAVNAARGQLRSQQAFMALLADTERDNKAHYDEYLKAMIEYKWHWENELDRRARLGIAGLEPLPHPDDIVVDLWANRITFKGPRTKEEKVAWDALHARVKQCDAKINALMSDAKRRMSKQQRELLQEELLHELQTRKLIVDAVGEPKS